MGYRRSESSCICVQNYMYQRIVRRDKKAFLSDKCKEIEENNRMGKTRDLFEIIRDTKGPRTITLQSVATAIKTLVFLACCTQGRASIP